MLALIAPLAAALLSTSAQAACPQGFPDLSPGWTRGVEVAGQSREVWTLLPEGPTQGAPLFIAFNGTSENGARFSSRARLQDFADRGFVVLAPSSHGNGEFWPVWDAMRAPGHEGDDNPDLALFDALVDCAVERLGVDADRVYAGGHSAGGIFSNHLVQRRSERLAGVIVASGLFSQTSPAPATPMAPTTVLVTWGGANDRWSGRAGGAAVEEISFSSEAALAGAAYAAWPGVQVLSCAGDERGHAWLHDLNGWMVDVLLAHPHGAAPLAELPPLPPGARAHCQLGAAPDQPTIGLLCPQSPTPGCQYSCQQISDGAFSNRTVGAVLRRELRELGFTEQSCDGCVARCEELAVTEYDAQGLACLSAQPPVDPKTGGIAKVMPLVDAVNTCCGPNEGPWCTSLCQELRGNLAARAYVPACAR